MERYIEAHADGSFSHGICFDCYRTIAKPELEELEARFPGNVSQAISRAPC